MAAGDNEQQLAEIKKKLEQRHKLLNKQQQQRQKLLAQLKKTELDIANTAAKLHTTSTKLKGNRQQQAKLEADEKTLLSQRELQRGALAKQLASAYMIGGNDLVQLVLNQQQSSKMERLLGYYKYFNQARLETLAQLKQTIRRLSTVEIALNQSTLALSKLEQKQRTEQSKLQQDEKRRTNALATLKKEYLANSLNIEQLQLSEIDIGQLIKQSLKETPRKKPLKGLAAVKGRLKFPSQGRVNNRFGQSRQGPLRWKGMTIDGKEGQIVKAVHHGKVLYADWVKGFGLVMVVDHGQGYMTLYGHNQTLLKNVGDYIGANEQIALLGQSGGQDRPVLYFELRHKGKAINPRRWFKA